MTILLKNGEIQELNLRESAKSVAKNEGCHLPLAPSWVTPKNTRNGGKNDVRYMNYDVRFEKK
jgi:hypothetical protein